MARISETVPTVVTPGHINGAYDLAESVQTSQTALLARLGAAFEGDNTTLAARLAEMETAIAAGAGSGAAVQTVYPVEVKRDTGSQTINGANPTLMWQFEVPNIADWLRVDMNLGISFNVTTTNFYSHWLLYCLPSTQGPPATPAWLGVNNDWKRAGLRTSDAVNLSWAFDLGSDRRAHTFYLYWWYRHITTNGSLVNTHYFNPADNGLPYYASILHG